MNLLSNSKFGMYDRFMFLCRRHTDAVTQDSVLFLII